MRMRFSWVDKPAIMRRFYLRLEIAMKIHPLRLPLQSKVFAAWPLSRQALSAPPHRAWRLGLRSLGWTLGLTGLLFLAALPAQAQRTEAAPAATENRSALSAELTQMQVAIENGKEVLKPVAAIKPGDLIEYRVVYTNRSPRVVRDVAAELPIPEGLEYQAKSARPAQTAEAAVAGGVFAREPLMRDIVGGKKEPVPYSEYRRLRWTLGQIAAGAKAEVSARARVSAGVPATQSGVQPAAQTAGGR